MKKPVDSFIGSMLYLGKVLQKKHLRRCRKSKERRLTTMRQTMMSSQQYCINEWSFSYESTATLCCNGVVSTSGE